MRSMAISYEKGDTCNMRTFKTETMELDASLWMGKKG